MTNQFLDTLPPDPDFSDTIPTTLLPEGAPLSDGVHVASDGIQERVDDLISGRVEKIPITDLLKKGILKEGDIIRLTLGLNIIGGRKNIQGFRVVRPFSRTNKGEYVKLQNLKTGIIYKLYRSGINSPIENAITLCIGDTEKGPTYYGYHGVKRKR